MDSSMNLSKKRYINKSHKHQIELEFPMLPPLTVRDKSYKMNNKLKRITLRTNNKAVGIIFCLTISILYVNANNNPLIPNPQTNKISSTNYALNPSSSSTSILEIFENESFDASRSTWQAGSKNRWTTSSGSQSDPPTALNPPANFLFESDWKIDVTGTGVGTRDNEGWEYFAGGKRRRRWLRTLTPIKKEIQKKVLEEKESIPKKGVILDWFLDRNVTKTTKITKFHPKSFLTPIMNDYNFKGFGISLYKSIIFPTSFGAIFRLPISTNFDFCETRPHIPSITSSSGFFGSHDNFTILTCINLSMPMEVVRYCFNKILKFIYLIYWLIWKKMIVDPIKWIIQLLFLSNKKQSKNKSSSNLYSSVTSILSSRSIQYSSNYQERIGCSLTWRISMKRGYEFRFNYFHIFLPTMESMILRNRNGQISNWFKEKTGSLGIVSSHPIPEYPTFSCSGILSLSGFYPNRMSFSKSKSTTDDYDIDDTMEKQSAIKIGLTESVSGPDSLDLSDETSTTNEISRNPNVGNEKKQLISSSFGWGSNEN